MHTNEKLALALEQVGLKEMAGKARTGYYHDFLSPLATPTTQLVMDLMGEATQLPGHQRHPILELRERVIAGDFDATLAESEEWAEGEEGRAAFERLAKGD